MGQVHRQHGDAGDALVSLVLEVMLGQTQRLVPQRVGGPGAGLRPAGDELAVLVLVGEHGLDDGGRDAALQAGEPLPTPVEPRAGRCGRLPHRDGPRIAVLHGAGA